LANKHRSEVTLRVTGGRKYTLRLGSNQLVEMEQAVGQKIPAIGAMMQSGNFGIADVRAMLWAALQKHHKQECASLEDAGDIMDEAGFERTVTAVGEAFGLAFPDAVEDNPKAKNGKPEAAGTGTASEETP
jgi:hypothetical protein